MSTEYNDLDTQPWYKQGWPWALIAIPFFTVIAGVTTFIIANNTSDSLVQDDYYKKGLAINSNLDRISLAATLSLLAKIEIRSESNLIVISLQSNPNLDLNLDSVSDSVSKQNKGLPDELILNFFHPTLQSKDKTIRLAKLSGNDYVGEFSDLTNAYWHISLEDSDKIWLMKARWLYPNNTSLVIDSKES
ncbi:MAG: FixH family protein [Kangiellaceae bacterium]|nr:FixH family protein [Kangiellaceae bacterium]